MRRGQWSLLLVAICLLAYWGYAANPFLVYRDNDYITQNYLVRAGFSPAVIGVTFRTYSTGLWHPVAWLSHMLDYQLFGLSPTGHHWTSILLHTGNSVLLFWLLVRTTNRTGLSLLTAVLFACHPIQVDTVAWVAQRKTIVGVFGSLLALHVFASYVRSGKRRHWVGFTLLGTLGMFASPALITLPLVMLLLDFWPLGRLPGHNGEPDARTEGQVVATNDRKMPESWRRLILEKLPLFLVSLLVGWQTVMAQEGNLLPSDIYPMGQRFDLAVVGYLSYLGRMWWPFWLGVEYPAGPVADWIVLVSGFSLVGVTAAVFVFRRQAPGLFVGWLWFLLALAPMSGIVQFARWSTADRLIYWPSIGIFLGVGWLAATLCAGSLGRRAAGISLAIAVVIGYIALDWRRQEDWKDSQSLFASALKARPDNATMHYRLGILLGDAGNYGQALEHFESARSLEPESLTVRMAVARSLIGVGKVRDAVREYNDILKINPEHADAYVGRGLAMATEGRFEEAIYNYQAALDLESNAPDLLSNLGVAYLRAGQLDRAEKLLYRAITEDPFNPRSRIGYGTVLAAAEDYEGAIKEFEEAARLDPSSADPLHHIANTLKKKGDIAAAEAKYREAIAKDPGFDPPRLSLALMLLEQQRQEEAIAVLEETLKVAPQNSEAAYLLGGMLVDAGEVERGLREFRRAVSLRDNWPEALNALAWILATHPDPLLRNGFEAVTYAERANRLTGQNRPVYIDTLAAAYAEDGKFDEAIRAAKVAIGLAREKGEIKQIDAMEQRLALYQQEQPYHSPPNSAKDE